MRIKSRLQAITLAFMITISPMISGMETADQTEIISQKAKLSPKINMDRLNRLSLKSKAFDQFLPLDLVVRIFGDYVYLYENQSIINSWSSERFSFSKLFLICKPLAYLANQLTVALNINRISPRVKHSRTHRFANFKNLRLLSLRDNSTMRDKDLRHLTHLTGLNLFMAGKGLITDVGITRLTNLTCLNLTQYEGITNVGIAPLSRLETLILSENTKITDQALALQTNLTRLDLSDNMTITNIGVNSLINLISLNLAGKNNITNAGLLHLTNITSLDICGNKSNIGSNRVLGSLPNLKYIRLGARKLKVQ